MPVNNLLQSEWEDLETRLRDRQRSPEDFDISRQGDAEIVVQHRHSGARRVYRRAAHGSWISDFIDDVDRGQF